MKYTIIGLLTLSLFGCSLSVPQPPVAKQTKNLFDNDSDGVINQRDHCPKTPIDAIVDNNGCPTYIDSSEENKIHVLFANDSSVIVENYRNNIKNMSTFLAKYPKTHIELKGYASPVGNAVYNVALSKRRASVIRQALINEGVTPARIKTVGFGDSDPIKASDVEESNTLSRRVVAQVIGSQGNVVKEWTVYTVREN
ncbi:OmpA family protein [Photobacterium carnosum]|jgi:outer membrane protein OmpA-like peptidoglycan-associated protein|uniref:OmpA family protein n=1 Tax=Photobacterium carnosum TaxID=2023717 RepID=UPI001C91DD66|nr:OmpA family protein [Photobacterium carnosum]MBY3790681.1 OmpA family protein [Photobacterium carnosum]MCD9500536.1 OmpA family protein [Photobacterium carnosum]MCD9531953.1 OmpA family protein [Photobacterium carnosum]MCD9535800.1 OmpA family protein [Photobacterium carnosum]MCF2155820.1 OmpA family protein [Photobacterium carnosum]